MTFECKMEGVPIITPFPFAFILIGLHRIGAKETEFMKFIDSNLSLDSSQANLLFPTNAVELRKMLQLFLLKPEKLYFHDRMMEAIVILRSKKYPSLRKGQC